MRVVLSRASIRQKLLDGSPLHEATPLNLSFMHRCSPDGTFTVTLALWSGTKVVELVPISARTLVLTMLRMVAPQAVLTLAEVAAAGPAAEIARNDAIA